MPLAFPSHQGLIAPLWRRWPGRFDALALSVGAAQPDIVDGVLALVRGGHLGQGVGHTLFGLVVLCLPTGIVLALIVRPVVPRVPFLREIATRGSIAQVIVSVLVGAFSHIGFDFISHENAFFPRFWNARWFGIPTPFYDAPYPVGLHFLVWLALSLAGAVMFFRPSR